MASSPLPPEDGTHRTLTQRRQGESLFALLQRLDEAIAIAYDDGEFTDEINPPG